MIRAIASSVLFGIVWASAAPAHAQAPERRRPTPARAPQAAAPAAAEEPEETEATDAAAAAAAEPDAAAAPEPGGPQTFEDEPVAPEPRRETIDDMDELQISASRIKLSLNMFGDGSYVVSRDDSGAHHEFVMGALGLLARGELSPSLAAVMELVFEVSEEGETIADLERLHLAWQTERVEVLAGRLHTPLGTWNDHYHHGLWLQLPVERPYVLRFEDDGGFLPIHWIGGLVTGRFDVGTDMRLNLTGGVGNGRGSIEDEILVAGDLDEAKSLMVKVELERPGERHWRAGVSGVFDIIAPQPADVRPSLPDQELYELVINAFGSYRADELTIISEGYLVDHQSVNQRWVTTDVFALVGYSLGSLTPYVLVEWIDTYGGADPFFVPSPESPLLPVPLVELLGGVRMDLSTWAALKGELRVTHYLDANVTEQALTLNWAFGI
jgi:hypothetical protein